jgi:hypothetical protein
VTPPWGSFAPHLELSPPRGRGNAPSLTPTSNRKTATRAVSPNPDFLVCLRGGETLGPVALPAAREPAHHPDATSKHGGDGPGQRLRTVAQIVS